MHRVSPPAASLLALALLGGCDRALPVAEPSVLLIVVDTLRADRLPSYGYPIDTSPRIRRDLAAKGVLFEDARAHAPWTLPSMISLFTGRLPGRDLSDAHPATFALPASRPTPAELATERGFSTGAFVGNPLLGPVSGFDRGFGSFWAPPADGAMDRHGADVTDRALAWLANAPRPFFAWVHYIDPHDPYLAPELIRGLAPDDPTYRGELRGGDVHSLFTGRRRSEDLERDARYLGSLYDAEIRHVDREIGRLLDGLGPELATTLVALTSDHGEELADHGGWKHARTVYAEQLHVPLILRWDGRLPAGQRFGGPVALVDLLPTLVEAAGLTSPAGPLDGASLLGRLRGSEPPLAPRTAAHHHTGPRRMSARLGRHELLLFDRDAPYQPESPLDAHLWRDELARLPGLALFDLVSDPRQQRDLAAERPELVARLATLAFDGLLRPGRQLAILGLANGQRLELELGADQPLGSWERLLLGAADRVAIDGSRLQLELVGDGRPKAVVVSGLKETPPTLTVHRSTLDALVGPSLLDGGVLPPLARLDGRPAVATWARADLRPLAAGSRDEELEATLRSLGYAQ